MLGSIYKAQLVAELFDLSNRFCPMMYIQQYVREIRSLFSDKESVVFRDFGDKNYRLRPFTVEV